MSIFFPLRVDILNEEPGSETASLLEVEKRRSPDQNMEYEDDFTDVEMSSEGDLGKVNFAFLLSYLFVVVFCQCGKNSDLNRKYKHTYAIALT